MSRFCSSSEEEEEEEGDKNQETKGESIFEETPHFIFPHIRV